METSAPLKELEVSFKGDSGKAVIEGMTAVPFQSLVTLILQRKVMALMKQWGKEPVVIGSELLTSLASSPQESTESRSHVTYVALGVGLLAGIALFAVTEVILGSMQVWLTRKELLLVAGSIAGVGVLVWALMKVKRVKKGEKVAESIEKLSSFLSGK